MKLRYYVGRRLVLLVPVLIGMSLVMFTLTHVVPSAPARLIGGPHATQETIDQINRELGLDKPLPNQYLIYMDRVLHGDLGFSIHTRRSVAYDLADYFPATFELTTISMGLTILLGIPLGIISATKKDRLPDHVSRISSLVGISMPVFWLGIILQLVFGSYLNLLPVSGRLDSEIALNYPIRRITGFLLFDSLVNGNWIVFQSAVMHIILPTITLTFWLLAVVARMSRSSMLEVLNQEYVQNARADGFSERTIQYKYALRNALIPTITVVGMTYGLLLGGDLMVETIFSWPGMGLYSIGSIVTLDFPAIVGVSLLVSLIFVIVNLAVDLLYVLIDPRIRY